MKISEEYSKHLKFYAGKNLLKSVALLNGLPSGPRKFTVPIKPPIACLRIEGVIVAIFIVDTFVIGDTYNMKNVLLALLKLLSYF